jgi:hypothetical protein
MDFRERYGSQQEAIKMATGTDQANIWTAGPGIIESINESAVTCSVQPAIQGVIALPNNGAMLVNLPVLVDVPIVFPRGGGCILTMPVAVGDECLIVIASRCIDAWWQNGGVQPPLELRMHDLSDGFALIGPFSQPQAGELAGGIVSSSAQLRSLDGSTSISLNPTAKTLTVTAPGGFIVDANMIVNGGMTVNEANGEGGSVQTTGDVVAGSGGQNISLLQHKHSQGPDTHGDTEQDTSEPIAGT